MWRPDPRMSRALSEHIRHVYGPDRVEQLEARLAALEELVDDLLTDQRDDYGVAG